MSIEVGAVLKGKVTGIQSFGAFVALEGENTQGLVHISEVSNTYVKDINDFLQVGQEVEVKVIKVDEANNKTSLSIRALMPNPEGNKGSKKDGKDGSSRRRSSGKKRGSSPVSYKSDPDDNGYALLADKLKDIQSTLFLVTLLRFGIATGPINDGALPFLQWKILSFSHNAGVGRANNFIHVNQFFNAVSAPANNTGNSKDRRK